MNSLESRKQLLIAESELNRAQLVREVQMIKEEVRIFANKAGTIASFASVAATLIGGIVSLRRKKEPAPAVEKSSWLQAVVKGAGLVSTIWTAFRPQRRDQDES